MTTTTTSTTSTSMTKTRTRKDRTRVSWEMFDNEMADEKPNKHNIMECLYRCDNDNVENGGNREKCERCKFALYFSDEGFLTCTNSKCGIIYKDVVDHTAEWRFYGADDNQGSDPTRCGMPINPLLKESSFGCKILISGPMSYEMRKIKRYTEWQSVPYKEKTQYEDFQRINTMAQNSGIPKLIIDSAIVYYKKISEYKLTFRGDNRDGIISSSIYIACRINNYPRTAKEIATIFNLDVSSATKGCKNAQLIINNLEKDLENNEKTLFCKTNPGSFIERYCSKLQINNELTKLCQFIAKKIEKQDLMPENTPNSIAAGIIYFISHTCNLHISKTQVKSISEISEVTINKCFKKIEKFKNELVPNVILQKYSNASTCIKLVA
jgi:transcription initiation factor TFIIB